MNLAMILAASLVTPAGYNTGQSISDQCGKSSAYLLGYVAGLADGTDNVAAAHPKTRAFCLPADVTLARLEGVVCTYLRQNPPNDMGITNAALHVSRALAIAFPCK